MAYFNDYFKEKYYYEGCLEMHAGCRFFYEHFNSEVFSWLRQTPPMTA
jgi:hypothetical protein